MQPIANKANIFFKNPEAFEEGLWDLAVWKEHKNIFHTTKLFEISLSNSLLSVIVPLLTLPQITHYILDGFIWKIKQEEFKWSNEVQA